MWYFFSTRFIKNILKCKLQSRKSQNSTIHARSARNGLCVIPKFFASQMAAHSGLRISNWDWDREMHTVNRLLICVLIYGTVFPFTVCIEMWVEVEKMQLRPDDCFLGLWSNGTRNTASLFIEKKLRYKRSAEFSELRLPSNCCYFVTLLYWRYRTSAWSACVYRIYLKAYSHQKSSEAQILYPILILSIAFCSRFGSFVDPGINSWIRDADVIGGRGNAQNSGFCKSCLA
jgi:hypothetical protein